MHPCLKVPELLYTIFESVNSGPYVGPCSLFHLALTCHTFHDVALDILWRSLPDMAMLIRCLPEDVWEEQRGADQITRTVSLVRDPSPGEWTRFLSYAARVRNMAHTPQTSRYSLAFGLDSWSVEESIYSTLLRLRGGQTIFPNLRRFEWYYSSEDIKNDLAYLQLLLGPKVNHMTVHSMKPIEAPFGDALCDILEDFGKRAPVMIRISAICPLTPRLASTISTMVMTQHHLRSLHIFQDHNASMSLEAALHLAQLPHLESLCLRPDRIDDAGGALRSLTEVASGTFFPAMESLTLYADDLLALQPFLARVQSTRLSVLQVIIVNAPKAAEVQSFYETLGRHPNINQLVCTSGSSSPRWNASYYLTAEHIRPLLALKRMNHCKLHWKNLLHLNDKFVKDLAMAWPRIHTLDLCGEWRREPVVVQVSLDGLMSLAEHCRNLQHLCILFEPNLQDFAETYDEERPGGGISSESLYTLNVGTSRIGDDIIMLAGVLSDIFPNLLYVSSSWGDRESPEIEGEDEAEEDESKQWHQLQKLCREMGRVRRQERRWFAQLPGPEAVAEYQAASS